MDTTKAEALMVQAAQEISEKWWDEHPEYANNRPEPGMGEDGPFMGDYGADWGEVTEQLWSVKDHEVGGYTLTMEEHEGGEGQGDQYWFVYSFTKGDKVQYFRLDATWVSWDGVYWDEAELSEVKPKEVTVREWARV